MRGHYEYNMVKYDIPIFPVIEVVEYLSKHLQPLFVSGRMDEEGGQVRKDTVWWIDKYISIIPAYPLFMRPAKLPDGRPDYRPDYIVKKEIYDKYIFPKYNVRFAIDDRLQVCRMWYDIGVPVFRVGDPDATY